MSRLGRAGRGWRAASRPLTNAKHSAGALPTSSPANATRPDTITTWLAKYLRDQGVANLTTQARGTLRATPLGR